MSSPISRQFKRAALLAGFAIVPATVQAQTFGAFLRGINEVPSNSSPAIGFSSVTISGHSLIVHLEFGGLTGGNASASHIHCCAPPGSNAPVAVGFGGFPAATSGIFDGTFDMTNLGIYNGAFLTGFTNGTAANAEAVLVAGITSGNAYVNIHNTVFPGGEVRGQLAVVPEPATLALVTGGLMVIAFGARRRRSTVAA